MGWCSGTELFDEIVEAAVFGKPTDKKEFLKFLIDKFENMDWDCQMDSKFADHPLFKEVFRELHPDDLDEDYKD
jgi:hypothetical protein